MYKLHTKLTQTRTTQLPHDSRKTNKRVSFSTGVTPTTSVSRPQLKSNQIEDRVLLNNSQEKKQEVEDHRRNVKFSKNKTSVTACNDSLKAKISNVKFVCATCGKCVLNAKHDIYRRFILRKLNIPTMVFYFLFLFLTIVKQDSIFDLIALKLWSANTSGGSYSCRKGHAFVSFPRIVRQLCCSSLMSGFEKSFDTIFLVTDFDFEKSFLSIEDRVLLNNSQEKKQEVEDHRRNVKFSKNKTSVTACNDSLKAKISNVKFVCATCGKCVLNAKHDMCVLKSRNSMNSRTKMPMLVPVSSREPKRIVNQSVATLRRTVASESTNQKPRHTTRKL
nr:hypothetical protein [Tanacetum cinerariifolium]